MYLFFLQLLRFLIFFKNRFWILKESTRRLYNAITSYKQLLSPTPLVSPLPAFVFQNKAGYIHSIQRTHNLCLGIKQAWCYCSATSMKRPSGHHSQPTSPPFKFILACHLWNSWLLKSGSLNILPYFSEQLRTKQCFLWNFSSACSLSPL